MVVSIHENVKKGGLSIFELSETIRDECETEFGNDVYALINNAFPSKYNRRILTDTSIGYKYLAFENNILVGFCFWQLDDDKAILYIIGVSDKHRRKGIGSEMFKHSISIFRQEKVCNELECRCRVKNPARNFHKAIGFKEDGIEEKYYKDGEDAVRLKMLI